MRTFSEEEADRGREKAAQILRERGEVRRQIEAGQVDLPTLLRADPQPVLQNAKIGLVLRYRPMIGPARAHRLLNRLGVSPWRTLKELSINQRFRLAELVEESDVRKAKRK